MAKKWILALLIQLVVLSVPAMADTMWNWSYAGDGVSASGTFTTVGSASGYEAITSITGTRNGQAILGLVPLGTDSGFVYDNQFISFAPYLNYNGVLFDVAGGVGHVNLYSIDSQLYDYSYSNIPVGAAVGSGIAVKFEIRQAVPEPSTLVLILSALSIFAFARPRRWLLSHITRF